jgi:hypothetical protein
MAYTTVEGRQQPLGALAEAIEIGLALASLSAAYERLDIATARTRSKKSCSAWPRQCDDKGSPRGSEGRLLLPRPRWPARW